MNINTQIITYNSYRCDVCKRTIKTFANKHGIDTFQRCFITDKCNGNMHVIQNQHEAKHVKVHPEPVDGVTDWFQKQMLYVHNQRFSASDWIIDHNLQCSPQVYAYEVSYRDNEEILIRITPTKIEVVDGNTVKLYFSQPVAGIAQCVSVSGQVEVTQDEGLGEEPLFKLTNIGELSIATTATTDYININARAINPDGTQIQLEFEDISGPTSLLSPWVTFDNVLIYDTWYKVRSFNILTNPGTSNIFANMQVQNGALISFYDTNVANRDILILMSNPPYAVVDKISDRLIDLRYEHINMTIIYDSGELFIQSGSESIRKIYPYIIGD